AVLLQRRAVVVGIEVELRDGDGRIAREAVAKDVQVGQLDVGGDDQLAAVHHAGHVADPGADFEDAVSDVAGDALPDPFVVARQASHALQRHIPFGFAVAAVEDAVLENRPDRADAVSPADYLSFPIFAAVVRDRDFEDAIAAASNFRGDLRLEAETFRLARNECGDLAAGGLVA